MAIKAGNVGEINLSSGSWIILDIGFANDKKASCGLMVDDAAPIELTFSDATKKIGSLVCNSNRTINLVIEAPLSVTFSERGNPTGRAIEKLGSKTRYWYFGLGCSVLVSAQYLIASLIPSCTNKDVRLFEGFVSFKPSGVTSNHSEDLRRLRQVIEQPQMHASKIVPCSALKNLKSDSIESAFKVMGYDLGIPPVIIG